jgi:hypothetical protein
MTDRQAARVSLDELEDEPSRFMNQRVSVDAEVEDVFGPRLFTIDEAKWADLDGEVLVFAPSFLATLVAENDRVTVSGTMKPYSRAELEREWGWIAGTDDQDLSRRAVLVADRVVGGNKDLALKIVSDPKPTGTSGAMSGDTTLKLGELTAIAAVVSATDSAIGNRVLLDNVTVDAIETGGGFWVRDAQGHRAFVLPSDRDSHKLTSGTRVSVKGVLLSMPRELRNRLADEGHPRVTTYVYATTVNM